MQEDNLNKVLNLALTHAEEIGNGDTAVERAVAY
jgi:hypothetical protein